MTQDNGQQWGQPQYTQQPQYTPYQPPRPPKKHRVRNVALGIIGSAALVIIVASITDSIASPKTPTATVAVTTRQTVGSKPAAPAAAPAGPADKVVLEGSGNGIKNTANFTTGSDWSIAYTFNCASFGYKGNFQIYAYDGSQLSGVPANELAMKGGATSYQHGDSGTHYLEINSECAWTVKVTDGDGGQ
jgi:hypothetical protein